MAFSLQAEDSKNLFNNRDPEWSRIGLFKLENASTRQTNVDVQCAQ